LAESQIGTKAGVTLVDSTANLLLTGSYLTDIKGRLKSLVMPDTGSWSSLYRRAGFCMTELHTGPHNRGNNVIRKKAIHATLLQINVCRQKVCPHTAERRPKVSMVEVRQDVTPHRSARGVLARTATNNAIVDSIETTGTVHSTARYP
jgi:hypothetical protein